MKRISRKTMQNMMPVGSRWVASWPNSHTSAEDRVVTNLPSWGVDFDIGSLRFEKGDKQFAGRGFVEVHFGSLGQFVRYTYVDKDKEAE